MSLNRFYEGKSAEEIHDIFELLRSSGDITLFWHAAFTFLTAALVYPGVRQGIEYWNKLMTSGLFIIMTFLCIYSSTLPGFFDAVKFLFTPDFSAFTTSSAIEALGLAFFTLSLGQGIMLTYGSYMSPEEDIPYTALLVGSMIAIVSLLAGLTIFPVIFTFGFPPQGGPGLVFQTLPLLFAKLPGSLLISTSFFILFTFAAFSSSVAFIEVVAANIMDLAGWSRHRAVISVAIGTFLFGIPSALANTPHLFVNWQAIYGKSFFATIDSLVSSWLLPVGGLLVALFAGWSLEKELASEELNRGSKWGRRYGSLFRTWNFFIRWLAPIAITIILLHGMGMLG